MQFGTMGSRAAVLSSSGAESLVAGRAGFGQKHQQFLELLLGQKNSYEEESAVCYQVVVEFEEVACSHLGCP